MIYLFFGVGKNGRTCALTYDPTATERGDQPLFFFNLLFVFCGAHIRYFLHVVLCLYPPLFCWGASLLFFFCATRVSSINYKRPNTVVRTQEKCTVRSHETAYEIFVPTSPAYISLFSHSVCFDGCCAAVLATKYCTYDTAHKSSSCTMCVVPRCAGGEAQRETDTDICLCGLAVSTYFICDRLLPDCEAVTTSCFPNK